MKVIMAAARRNANLTQEETREISDSIETADPLDLLWQQIKWQYAAIVRAQQIAYVKDQQDLTVRITMESEGESGDAKAFSYQEAWDKQANFLKAQSRAMDALRGLIRQYDEMLAARGEDAAEEKKLNIQLLRAKLGEGSKDTLEKLDEVLQSIGGVEE